MTFFKAYNNCLINALYGNHCSWYSNCRDLNFYYDNLVLSASSWESGFKADRGVRYENLTLPAIYNLISVAN